jgi:hypothetical protein
VENEKDYGNGLDARYGSGYSVDSAFNAAVGNGTFAPY